jgi:hypothetical protein
MMKALGRHQRQHHDPLPHLLLLSLWLMMTTMMMTRMMMMLMMDPSH